MSKIKIFFNKGFENDWKNSISSKSIKKIETKFKFKTAKFES